MVGRRSGSWLQLSSTSDRSSQRGLVRTVTGHSGLLPLTIRFIALNPEWSRKGGPPVSI
jgi:hypothetical protein